MARRIERADKVDEIGGIPVGRARPPGWLMFVIVGVIAWGLYYLITYTVTDTGTFPAPGVLLRL